MMPIKCNLRGIGCSTCGRTLMCPEYTDIFIKGEEEMKKKICQSESNCKCCPDQKVCDSYEGGKVMEKKISINTYQCEGQGFNCHYCTRAGSCPEYIEVPEGSFSGSLLTREEMKENIKPPLGLTPKYIWEEKRLQEISEAIGRYAAISAQIPQEWLEEYNELAEKIAYRGIK